MVEKNIFEKNPNNNWDISHTLIDSHPPKTVIENKFVFETFFS